MLREIPGAQGHHMYTDRFNISYFLAEELAKAKCSLTGIILTERKKLPEGKKAKIFDNRLLTRQHFSFKMERQEDCYLFDYKG